MCTVALLSLFTLAVPAQAGEIEAQVIDASTDALFETENWADVTADTWDEWVTEAIEVYEDTTHGDCATYAALTVSYLSHLRDAFVDVDARTWHWDAAYAEYFQFDQYHYLCEQE